MKKYLYVILALTLSFCLLMTGCGKGKADANPTDTSAPGTQSDTVSTAPTPQTPSTETPKTQVRTGTYVCEYGDYIFYRNTNDNGSIYRYNIKDDSYIRLYDENYNAFLHSLTIYDEFLYFVTKTENDTSPTLYRISINGGKAESLIKNVSDDFCVTEDAIYCTIEGQLYKYTFSDKQSTMIQKLCLQFNLIDDKIYMLALNYNYTGYELAYFDIATQTITSVPTNDIDNFQYASAANNGKIIYLSFVNFLYSYNTETQEFKEIISNVGNIRHIIAANDNLVYFYTQNENNEYKIYQYKDGTVSEYTDRQFEKFQVLEVVDNKPVMISASSMGPQKIIGDERLNVIVDEAKVGDVLPNDNNVMVNYYGMTINDVIELWGSNYELDSYYISDGFAGIKYSHKLCPYTFYFNASQMPDSINGDEKITFIESPYMAITPNFYITDDINLEISFNELSTLVDGKYDLEYVYDVADKNYEAQFYFSKNIKVDIVWYKNNSTETDPANYTSNVSRVYFSY